MLREREALIQDLFEMSPPKFQKVKDKKPIDLFFNSFNVNKNLEMLVSILPSKDENGKYTSYGVYNSLHGRGIKNRKEQPNRLGLADGQIDSTRANGIANDIIKNWDKDVIEVINEKTKETKNYGKLKDLFFGGKTVKDIDQDLLDELKNKNEKLYNLITNPMSQ